MKNIKMKSISFTYKITEQSLRQIFWVYISPVWGPGLVRSVWQKARGWMAGVKFLAGESDVSLLHSVQTSSGAHPAYYSTGTGGSLPRGKAARA
jgi:hypothetical protein